MLFAALVFPLLVKAAVLPELISQDDTVNLVKDVNVPVRFMSPTLTRSHFILGYTWCNEQMPRRHCLRDRV